MTDEKTKPPQCQNRKLDKNGTKRRCTSPGVWCWVYGEYGRLAKILCGACITSLRSMGWKVHYQLEGDKPPAESVEL